MSQSLTLDVKGLYTYNSDVAGVPAGTLAVADNVNITRMNVLEPRRGFEYFYQGSSVLTFGTSSDRVKKFVFYKESNYIHYASTFALFSGSGVSSRGTLITPSNATSIRDVSYSNKNLYLTNSTGILKTDATATSLYAAGIPQGLSISLSLRTGTTGTAVAANKFVSYRYLIGRKDANGNTQFSAPSQKATIQAGASACDILALCYIPSGLDVNYFIQLYRTAEFGTNETGEEYFLVNERQLSSTNGRTISITNVSRTDNVVYIATDGSHNLVEGQKVTVLATTNTGVNGTFYISLDSTNSFYYVKSGADIPGSSDTGSVTTGSDLTDKAVYIVDITPPDLTGATLYTSPSQEGAVNENNEPPLAADIAEYQNCMWYADITQKQNFTLELIASTLFIGTTLTIGSEIYTGRRSADYTTRQFAITAPRLQIATVASTGTVVTIVTNVPHELISTDNVDVVSIVQPSVNVTNKAITIVNTTTFTYNHGSSTFSATADTGYVTLKTDLNAQTITASVALRILNTAESIIKAINENPSGAYYAYSLNEGQDVFPGKMFIEARSFAGSQFEMKSSQSLYWQPTLNATVTSESQKSQADTFRNGLMWSKPDQPEAVPYKNIFRVGSADDPILRIWAARDALFVFKQRDGLWIIRGETEANWTKNQLDVTAKLYAPDSLASVNNTLYALMEAGVCEISDTGVNVLSFPIRDLLFESYTSYAANTKAYAFGMGNDTEGKYILNLPENAAYAKKQIVFDVYSRIFCGAWYIESTSGRLNPYDQKLYYGPIENKIKKELRTFTATDFADEYQTLSILAVDGTGLILTLSSVSEISVNDIIKQGSVYVYIKAVNNATNQVTVDMIETWTLSAANLIHYKALNVKIEWNSEFAGNPAGFKHFYEMALLQKSSFLITSTFYFRNDINSAENSITIQSPTYSGNWGDFTWGDETWGGDPTSNTAVRLGIPRTHARCSQLRVRWEHKVAYSWFQVYGISLVFNPVSTRIMRNAAQ